MKDRDSWSGILTIIFTGFGCGFIGLLFGRMTIPEKVEPAPVASSVASSVASTGKLCIGVIDECLASNRECVVMLKEAVGKADDYLKLLEKASGKNLHRDAGRD